eukprot:8933671-Alexandrium_andersonii.AAC.1
MSLRLGFEGARADPGPDLLHTDLLAANIPSPPGGTDAARNPRSSRPSPVRGAPGSNPPRPPTSKFQRAP